MGSKVLPHSHKIRPQTQLPPGVPTQVGNYRLLEKVGEGAMGEVFKAQQRDLDRIVAVKILKDCYAQNRAFTNRFQSEARASARLVHPHIVQGIDVGMDPRCGKWFFAMEFVDGPTTKQILVRQGPLAEAQLLQIAREMAQALECARRSGMVHRDIKPDNIILTREGSAKLADLGLAISFHSFREGQRTTDRAEGTPNYIAPEQATGRLDRIDIRTDIYCLGATLFHLATGRPLFLSQTRREAMIKHVREEPPKAHELRPELSPGLGALLDRMLRKQPEERFASPLELLKAIDALAAALPQRQTPPPTSSSRLPRIRARRFRRRPGAVSLAQAAGGEESGSREGLPTPKRAPEDSEVEETDELGEALGDSEEQPATEAAPEVRLPRRRLRGRGRRRRLRRRPEQAESQQGPDAEGTVPGSGTEEDDLEDEGHDPAGPAQEPGTRETPTLEPQGIRMRRRRRFRHH